MSGICSLRTLCATCCIIAALLAGGSVRAISFSAIEVPQPSWAAPPLFANTLTISSDGSRLGGIIVAPHVIYDCATFLCATGFDWSLPDDFHVTTELGPSASMHLARTLAVSPGLAIAQDGSLKPFAITSSGVVSIGELVETTDPVYSSTLSYDGRSIAGSIGSGLSSTSNGFLWNEDSGLTRFDMPGQSAGTHIISGDGNVVVGLVWNSTRTERQLFRWSESTGAEFLEHSDGLGQFRTPEAVNLDGTVIVGNGNTAGARTPFIWSTTEGMQQLPLTEEFNEGVVFDTTSAGEFLVGFISKGRDDSRNWSTAGALEQLYNGLYQAPIEGLDDLAQAVFWKDGQVHNLQTWLTQNHNLGDELAGWNLISANAISADGLVIAGVGINPEGHFQGWVVDLSPAAVVPEPATSVMLLAATSLIIAGWVLTRRPS